MSQISIHSVVDIDYSTSVSNWVLIHKVHLSIDWLVYTTALSISHSGSQARVFLATSVYCIHWLTVVELCGPCQYFDCISPLHPLQSHSYKIQLIWSYLLLHSLTQWTLFVSCVVYHSLIGICVMLHWSSFYCSINPLKSCIMCWYALHSLTALHVCTIIL